MTRGTSRRGPGLGPPLLLNLLAGDTLNRAPSCSSRAPLRLTPPSSPSPPSLPTSCAPRCKLWVTRGDQGPAAARRCHHDGHNLPRPEQARGVRRPEWSRSRRRRQGPPRTASRWTRSSSIKGGRGNVAEGKTNVLQGRYQVGRVLGLVRGGGLRPDLRTGRLQLGAFIVLCGLTHLLAAFTYEPHPFVLVLLLTVAKCLTAITLLRLIPQQRSCSASRAARACSRARPTSSRS
ncbi:uncharacterized protein LOC125508829 [Triticum urartu]|uniref:uncharacterized protein LOC125508829 n=1 Tax=Triticum urartu TaxID=4572 RepID=UPI0020441455|nr:uncharacterized protein LOC125508829 [Triticum urartu]